MKEKIKKAFATIMLPIVVSHAAPLIKTQNEEEGAPETIHTEYQVSGHRNVFFIRH